MARSKSRSNLEVKVTRSKILVSMTLITRNTHVKYKSYMLRYSKVIAQIKVFVARSKRRSNIKVKVTGSKILIPMERSYHKEYTCEILKPYVVLFKSNGPG